MNEVSFAAVSTAIALAVAIVVVRLSGRQITSRQAIWVAAAGAVLIALLTALRLALPEFGRILAVGLVGIALSAILIWLAFRQGNNLPTGQIRRLLALAVAGVVIAILGAAVQLAR